MTDSLYRLVYLSRNDIAGGQAALDADIRTILAASRLNNTKVGVTGALMFNSGCFAQVLEGPHQAVQATFERIQCDERHSNVTILLFEPSGTRAFSHWAMAYVGRDQASLAQFADLSDKSDFDPSALDGDDIYDVLKAQLHEAESA